MKRNTQLKLLKNVKDEYGGTLRNTRYGRSYPRPIATRFDMHLVLRSSLAVGKWSFKTADNRKKIESIVSKFSIKYGIKIYSLANVGNHLHFHIKSGNRYVYRRFIRAITSAIAMAITGISRWNKSVFSSAGKLMTKFWDQRPFTQIITSFKQLLNLKDYIEINRLEGFGCDRTDAVWIVKEDSKLRPWKYRPPDYA